MNDFLAFLYKYRIAILMVMALFALLNLFFLIGEWHVFFGVLFGQIWSGQCFYSFISGREMRFSAGARIEKESNIYIRGGLVFWPFLSIFCCFFLMDIDFYKKEEAVGGCEGGPQPPDI